MTLETKRLYRFGRFQVNCAEGLLLRDGEPVPLTPKAFEILAVLVQNSRHLVTKDELMKAVWPNTFVEEANLTVNISLLRRALGNSDEGWQYIETVPRRGYRFNANVEERTEEGARPDIATGERTSTPETEEVARPVTTALVVTEPTRSRTIRRHRVVLRLLGLACIALLALGYFAYRKPSRQPSRAPESLAILPFQNLKQDADSDFLSLSLADAVITKLSYVSQLTVRPSSAIEKYRHQVIDIPKVAADLKVATLLTANFVRDGNDLRITAQLIDARSEKMLWASTFDVKYEKLLTVQDEVAQQIIRELELNLSPSEAERLKPDEPVDPLAYEYYLRGVDLYARNDFPMAIKMLEKSAEMEPKYALTWAHLGRAYTASASFQFGGREQYAKAQAAYEKALALRPAQIEAHIYMANLFTDIGQVERAVPLLKEALGTNPNHAEVHWELGYAYRFAGMLRESVAECERARQLDPGVKLNSSALNSYLYLGQYDQFLRSLPPSDDVAFIVFYRGFGEYYQRNWERAAKDFDHAFELDPLLLHAQVGKALSLGIERQRAKGLEILRGTEAKIEKRGVGDPEAMYKIAQAYAALGDKAAALRVLGHSIENGFFCYSYFQSDPLLDSLRNEADFNRLMSVAQVRHEAFKSKFF